MKYICDAKKVKMIRKAIKKIRMQKIDKMLENPPKTDLREIIEKTLPVKEENILITGNPKQGLKLRIHKSHLKFTLDNRSNKDKDPMNRYQISEVSEEEQLHRKRMNEFLTHMDRRTKIVNKIKELRERKKKICKVMNYVSQNYNDLTNKDNTVFSSPAKENLESTELVDNSSLVDRIINDESIPGDKIDYRMMVGQE